ncbi:MAG TPA: xyloglucanase [Candidatus Sulfotelmatobacter sp.]|nr:xyloglucanase [Candidatus Sulfotelmatobacter sp.]
MPNRNLFVSSFANFGGLLRFVGVAAFLLAPFIPPTLLAGESDSRPYHFQNVVMGGGGGFIPGIVFSTTEPGLVYARTDIGGAYRLDPKSGSWIPLLDWIGFPDWNLSGVESIAIDPRNPQRVYFAVGTYTNEWSSQNGAILRSNNQGRTFQRFDLPFKVGSNMPGRGMGERLAIDPNNTRVLYLGTRSGNGLWRSVDSGETWSQVTSFPDTGPYHEPSSGPFDTYDNDPIGVVWVTFDSRTSVNVGHMKVSQNIYVGVADPANSLWHSADGGKTWSAVAGQPTGVMPHHGKLSSTGILYLSYNNNAGPYDGSAGNVWKYDTGSGTWTDVTPPQSPLNGGYGFGGLSVDALNPSTIVVAALNQWWPDTQFFRTLDGGQTWSMIWNVSWTNPAGWPPYVVPNYSIDYASVAPWLTFGATPATCTQAGPSNGLCPQPTPKLGWMVESLEIDPFNSDRMLYGTGATMYGTNNFTAWDSNGVVNVSVAAVGIEETAVQELISPPAGTAHLISAIADNGGYTHNDLTAPSVMDANPVFTTGTSLDYAELNPSFIVRVGSGGTNGMNIGFSADGGQTWTPAATQPWGASGGNVSAAADSSRVVWSSGAGVFFSVDDGTNWTASTGVPTGASVRSDRVNPLKFYAFANGAFYISTDGGQSFAGTAANNLPPAGTSAQFKATPGREGDIWLAGGSTTTVYGIWHSRDGGNSFSQLWNVDAASTIGFGKPALFHKYPALYSSAEVCGVWGIYRSDDAGWTWTRVNDDRHQYALTNQTITGDPRIYGRVYVGTNGRGIIYGDPVRGR